MKFLNKLTTVAFIGLTALSVRAESVEEAKALQDAALAAVKSKGLEAAVKEFNAGGSWKKGSLYIVVAKFDGQMLAHSANDKIVGKNMFEAKDASGKPFVQETISAVKSKGSSTIDLRWANPVTKQIADATFIARRVPGSDAYIGTVVFK
jgi:signal transduction histidine kinase